MLPGKVGQLEALVQLPQTDIKKAAIICHPHPLFGGTMDNKVVHTLAKAFFQMGYATVRFNFRGVGKSEGVYGEAIGETEDTLAVIDWLKKQWPDVELTLAGFSFGAYVAARTASFYPVAQLVSIAPSVEHADFYSLKNIVCPWLVVQGEKDEVVPPESVYKWVASRKPPPTLIRLPDVTHFFHGHLIELQHIILDNLS